MADLYKLGMELIKDIPELEKHFHSEEYKTGVSVFAKRVELDLSQNELSSLSGVDIKDIHRIEGGTLVNETALNKVLKTLNLL